MCADESGLRNFQKGNTIKLLSNTKVRSSEMKTQQRRTLCFSLRMIFPRSYLLPSVPLREPFLSIPSHIVDLRAIHLSMG